ncbi:MAG: type II secretion system F family protein, partial [Kiritimatiellae bacterium]|nr:type II secretion system F family protein [Kiritimatiellia bacterium]
MLLDAGLAPQDAIEPAGEATGSSLVAAGASDAAAAVRGGASLSSALGGLYPVSRMLLAWVAVGEKTGSLAEMLHRASDRAAAEYGRRLRRALSLLEPALVAAVGAIVLAVALAVIRPMLDLTLRH